MRGRASAGGAASPTTFQVGFWGLLLAGLLPTWLSAETVVLLPPPPTEFLSPQEGEEVSSGARGSTFAWTAVPGVGRYHLEVAAEPNFHLLLWENYLELTRHDLIDLPPGRYYWRVSSIDGCGLEGLPSRSRLWIVTNDQDPVEGGGEIADE